jgi:hypothetical protein
LDESYYKTKFSLDSHLILTKMSYPMSLPGEPTSWYAIDMRDQPGFNRGTSRSSFASKRSAWNTEQWYQPLTVSPACSDAESGLTAQRVSTDNQTWTASLSLTASAEVYAKCTNGSGLVSSGWVGTIYVDSTLPSGTVTETPTACTNGNISLSLHPTDSPSGIAQSWGNFSYDPTGSAVSVSGGGDLTIASPTQNTSFAWWTQDQAGHITSSSFAVTNLDRSAPTNPTGSASELNHQVGRWRLHRIRRSRLQLDGFCGCAQHLRLPGGEPV